MTPTNRCVGVVVVAVVVEVGIVGKWVGSVALMRRWVLLLLSGGGVCFERGQQVRWGWGGCECGGVCKGVCGCVAVSVVYRAMTRWHRFLAMCGVSGRHVAHTHTLLSNRFACCGPVALHA